MALRLVGMHPRQLALEVDLLPGEPAHIGGAEPRRQGERRHVSEMRRQLLEQCRRPVAGQESDPPRGLFQEPHDRRPIQPQEAPQPSLRIANHRYLHNILDKQYIAFITN